MVRRDIDHLLLQWKERHNRLPLIIRGARQVGKSYSVLAFGSREFESTAVVNFEKSQEFATCFEVLEPRRIIQELEILLHQPIIPGKTLLFFDEIQECPRAITALRYFKEEMPELHVIAAGSLLEFVLDNEDFSFPVGRVEFLFLRPLTFSEFLEAANLTILKEHIGKIDLQHVPSKTVHEEFLRHIRLYLLIGGMPAVVQKYKDSNSIFECRQIENALLQTYEQDFGKYATKTQYRHLQRLFTKCPEFVGSAVKYSKIDPEAANPAREYKQAIRLLANAGLLSPVHATSANGLPLRAEANEKKFKLLFLDVGLLLNALDTDPMVLLESTTLITNKGAMAEQLVGQELLAYTDPYRDAKLYFWERNRTGSEAEVDYVINIGPHIIPVEVKAGTTGRLKSLRQFMQEKKSSLGIKISEDPLEFTDGILTCPFYLISQLPRLVTALL